MSITFVQIGSDEGALEFLQLLDTGLECKNSAGEAIDIIDTIKDTEVKKAMDEMKEPGFMGKGGGGAMFGAFAGMCVGAGAYYLHNKMQKQNRTEGWNGTWEVVKNGEPTGVQLTVTDDMAGNITIEGYPEDFADGEASIAATYEDAEEGFSISRQNGDGAFIAGTVVDEHEIEWQDDTTWREVPPEGVSWAKLSAAAAGGAAAGGAAGYLAHKKFFKKATNKEPSQYKIVIDRSANMAVEG